MDAKGKQAGGGIEFAIISSLVFLGLDSKPRIPVSKNFRILAWIDRDRANIKYFRRLRLSKCRNAEKNKRDHKINFATNRSRNHLDKFHFSSTSIIFLIALTLFSRASLPGICSAAFNASSNSRRASLVSPFA